MKGKDKRVRVPGVDIGLAVLCKITPRGHTWSRREIADVCGCSDTLIYEIEQRALRKLHSRLEGWRD